MRILGSIAMGLALIGSHPALGQSKDRDSGNYYLPHCRAMMDSANAVAVPDIEAILASGQCAGIVAGMMTAGKFLTADYRYCVPDTVNLGQALKVVIRYLDTNPNQLHYDFRYLVLATLKGAFPCK
jgi:hypothetical protein